MAFDITYVRKSAAISITFRLLDDFTEYSSILYRIITARFTRVYRKYVPINSISFLSGKKKIVSTGRRTTQPQNIHKMLSRPNHRLFIEKSSEISNICPKHCLCVVFIFDKSKFPQETGKKNSQYLPSMFSSQEKKPNFIHDNRIKLYKTGVLHPWPLAHESKFNFWIILFRRIGNQPQLVGMTREQVLFKQYYKICKKKTFEHNSSYYIRLLVLPLVFHPLNSYYICIKIIELLRVRTDICNNLLYVAHDILYNLCIVVILCTRNTDYTCARYIVKKNASTGNEV